MAAIEVALGGGVDGAVHRAAGPRLAEAGAAIGPCDPGDAMTVADTLGARSVAFPAIATGIYGFPPDQAASIAVQAIRSTPTAVEQVRLVAFDQLARDILQAARDP